MIYNLLQFTWGLPQTLVGLIYYLIHIRCSHYKFKGATVTVWKSKSSLSLGKYIFVTEDPFFYYESMKKNFSEEEFSRRLVVHEYGHTIQSLIFGPLYLITIGLPSIVWSFLPYFEKKRQKDKISYFSVYPENWANHLGELVSKEESIGEPT